MRYLVCLLLLTITSYCFGQNRKATGLIFNDDTYKLTKRLSPALKWGEKVEPVYSLKRYCPSPGNQGDIGSCVGWATGYAALTIAGAIRANNNNTDDITTSARSALYLYLQIADQCPKGTQISDALNIAHLKGDCLNKELTTKTNVCGTTIPEQCHRLASQFKIKDYYALFDLGASSNEKINATRNSISIKKPVIIGMQITSSFYDVPKNGVWSPQLNEKFEGGHALCVIGYDDINKRFEIINSWDTDWGNQGFFTISYADYGRLCKYGYQFTLENPVPTSYVNLTGVFKFKKFKGFINNNYVFEETPVQLIDNYYTIKDVKLNDFFRLESSNITKDKYVYIFSIKPDNSAELLFPTTKSVDGVTIKDMPIVPSNNAVLSIPVDEKKGLTTDMAGTDLMCILYSTELIPDIEDIIRQLKQHDTGSFYDHLKTALGTRLIAGSDINYSSNQVGFTAKSTTGTIAPIILKVNVQ